jgi:hypothetical protein
MKLPPLPKWSKTTDDIDSEDFLRRLEDCQRSLLPPGIVFPRAGQIWETLRDCRVHVSKWMVGPVGAVAWRDARLQEGERVRILTLDNPKPLRVIFQPVRYEELHESIAADSLRYSLWVWTAPGVVPVLGKKPGYFIELFKLVGEVAQRATGLLVSPDQRNPIEG